MGHTQPSTKIQVENTKANDFDNKTLKQKRFKAIDMRFYWIQDQCAQGKFKMFWRPGSTNIGNYHTKHHSPAHQWRVHHKYLHTDNVINQLMLWLMWGYVNYLFRAHSHAPDNTLHQSHNTQALTARTIIISGTKYGDLPASPNSLGASKLGSLRALSSLS